MELEESFCLRSLSDDDLLLGLSRSLRVSRGACAEVVAHLAEVEERRLHLIGGYSSMFAYCVSRLGMSEDEAYRRLEAARLARRFPRLLALLASGQVSLSVAVLLKARLTDENHAALLDAVSGKTVEQSREVLASWFPRSDVLPLIRKLPTLSARVRHDAAKPSVAAASASELAATSPAVATGSAPKPNTSRSIEPLAPGRYKLQLTASAELKGKLELARDLLRHTIPGGDLAELIERALDVLLAQTMKRRFGRAQAAPKKPTEPTSSKRGARPSTAKDRAPDTPVPSRHIPNDVRRAVQARDDMRCTWRGPDGTPCNSRAWLEHDHATPWARGGTSAATNIRLRCRPHNRLAAEEAYGRQTIARIIARKQRSRGAARSTDLPPPET
jgi:hypothetical protein